VTVNINGPQHIFDNLLKQLARQCDEDSKRWFPRTADNLFYMVACMAGEAGETINEVKKIERGSTSYTNDQRTRILNELTDTMVYLLNVFAILNADPLWWYQQVRLKNEARFGDPTVARRAIPIKDNPQA